MADIELTMTTNGGLLLTIGTPDTIEIDASNMAAATDTTGVFRLLCTQDSDLPQAITFANFLETFADGTTLETSGGGVVAEFDDGNAQFDITAGELRAVGNYSLSVGGTNADCYIDNAGRIAPFTSSREVKENIRDAREFDVAKLTQLRPRAYNRIGQPDEEIGLVAEEVAEVWPELVSWKTVEIEPGTKPNGKRQRRFEVTDRPMGVNLSRLAVPLLRLAQSQAATIAALTSRIEALEAR